MDIDNSCICFLYREGRLTKKLFFDHNEPELYQEKVNATSLLIRRFWSAMMVNYFQPSYVKTC